MSIVVSLSLSFCLSIWIEFPAEFSLSWEIWLPPAFLIVQLQTADFGYKTCFQANPSLAKYFG